MGIIQKKPVKHPLPHPWVWTKNGPRKLYAAFGSNLHIKTMQRRCPDAEPVRKKNGKLKYHMLSNAQLVFRGVADLDYSPGSKVPVGLWWISERDEKALDSAEGFYGEGNPDNSYQKFHIWLDKEKTKQAMFYLMTDRVGIKQPSAHYYATVRDGYRNFGLDQHYLDSAIEHAFNNKTPSAQTIARRARQKKNSLHEKLVPMPASVQIARLEAERQRAEQERLAREQEAEQLRQVVNQPAEELPWTEPSTEEQRA